MDLNIKNMLHMAKKPSSTGKVWEYKSQLPLLTLMHFSDVHSDNGAMKLVSDFMEEYGDLVEDCIHTGDVMNANFFSDFSFWDQNGRNKKILNCIGNHDVLADEGWDWSKRTPQKDAFEKYFKPYIDNWNCVYEENKTYYYKDYPENAIRLIVLNSNLDGEENDVQLSWLENVLSTALENKLHVICAIHHPVFMKKIPCNFSSLDRNDGVGEKKTEAFQEKVKGFIDNGGDFVTWLAGHMHIDYIGYNEAYPDQLCIAVDSLNCYQSNAYTDGARVVGLKSEELYNLITVDTVDKLVKIIRVGCDLDRYLRKKDTLCINYKTFEIIK